MCVCVCVGFRRWRSRRKETPVQNSRSILPGHVCALMCIRVCVCICVCVIEGGDLEERKHLFRTHAAVNLDVRVCVCLVCMRVCVCVVCVQEA
jgi:hypothetical protein